MKLIGFLINLNLNKTNSKSLRETECGNWLDWQHKGMPAMLPQEKLYVKDLTP
jgi:hypothetical protein